MMKKKALRQFMPKRLTKALRKKRRWVGVKVDPSCLHRADVEALLETATASLEPKPNLRLMDWWPLNQRPLLGQPSPLAAEHPEAGLAVIRIHLGDAPLVRATLEPELAYEQHGLQTLTMSGKICLVRERLGLPRPKR